MTDLVDAWAGGDAANATHTRTISDLVSRWLIVVVGLALFGCSAAKPSVPAYVPPTPFSTLVDTISKPSAEPGKWILAALFRSNIVTSDNIYLVATDDSPANRYPCYEVWSKVVDSIKLLDPLHPEAIQPAIDVPQTADNNVSSDQVAGWLTWQVLAPPTGCAAEYSGRSNGFWPISGNGSPGGLSYDSVGKLPYWRLVGPTPPP
jgi:hypothetical protein